MPADAVTIRLVASPNNISTKYQAILTNLQEICFESPSDRRQLGDSYWWLAYRNKKPVGFAGLKPDKYGNGFLCLAGVVPEARGHGIHRRMITARVKFGRQLGLKRLYTYTKLNPASANSLIAAGFRAYLPPSMWAGDASYWQKGL